MPTYRFAAVSDQVGGPFEVLVDTDDPDITQVGSSTDGILAALTDGDTDKLTPASSVAGVDAVFAFQYDVTIGPGGEFFFSPNIVVIPEPGSITLLLMVGIAGLVRSRTR